MEYFDFTNEVRRGMRKKSINIMKLAKMADIDYSFLYKIMKGERVPPSNEKIRNIARVLDLKYEHLLILSKRVPPVIDPALKKDGMSDVLKTIGKMSNKDWMELQKVINKHIKERKSKK